MTSPIQPNKTYGVLHTESFFSFLGFAKKIGSDETQKIDVFLDDKLIDTIEANELIQKIDDMYDVESKAFTYNLPTQYIGKKAIISFKNHDSQDELLNSPYTLIDKNHEKFNEAKFLHSLSEPLSEELRNMYKPNCVGFLATKENLEDEEFMNYIKELIERFPNVEFKGFCFKNSEKELLQKRNLNNINLILLENIDSIIINTSILILHINESINNNYKLWNYVSKHCSNIHSFHFDSSLKNIKIDENTRIRFTYLLSNTNLELPKEYDKNLYQLWCFDSIQFALISKQFINNNFLYRNRK
ncbi:hypothetical protein [Aliarcobacter skirrowii]|uniref:hypothetical protein n=1 Tax=Aliarcobacter skirrowii TaxID=28200 RepID=UPI000832FAE0|nr:hypothetical protein [Aliarcobacter skirrowii]